ncbi:hypothetical protein [Klebsiella pneumoniae]|uniref:hypothetical protein n=1 Tax=Klebsiella pneumoniae TaxID=573 RepID=UPI001084803A|nr:hypothetical protein [Klebsiella pneumoniae]
MDLTKIRFRGFDVNSSSLQIHDASQGGKYRIKFLDDYSIAPDNDEDGNWFTADVKVILEGYVSDEQSKPVFEVNVSLTLSFECGFEGDVTKEFYHDNYWFFENYVFVAAKISIEHILKDTVLETISMPWAPKL